MFTQVNTTLHNSTNLLQNSTKLCTTLHTYKTFTTKLLQNYTQFYKTIHNYTKHHKALQDSRELYNTLHHYTQLCKALARVYKALQNVTKLHNTFFLQHFITRSQKLCKTLQKKTETIQHFTICTQPLLNIRLFFVI
jgi:hypothetical protein